jgi:hypothetical protein
MASPQVSTQTPSGVLGSSRGTIPYGWTYCTGTASNHITPWLVVAINYIAMRQYSVLSYNRFIVFRLTLAEQYYSGARTPSVGHVSRLRGEGEDARDPCHCISY